VRFGAYLYGDPRATGRESRILERHGFSTIWFGEAPTMGFGDPFIGMADAARAADSVRVGTAVAALGVRPAATLVAQAGTVNSVAPGRTTLGVGTGLFTRRILGLPPLGTAEFRSEVEQLRRLLDGKVAHANGHAIEFREPGGGVRLDPPIDLWVAAGGPKTAAVAGELGDGLMANGTFDPTDLGSLRRAALEAAGPTSRDPRVLKFGLEAGPVCVVRDGEDLRSPRVLDLVEPGLTLNFVFCAVMGMGPDRVPREAADAYAEFLREVRADHGPDPGDLLFASSDVVLRRQEKNDRFFTPSVIEACTMTGHRSELRDRIADMASVGLTDIAVLRSRSYEWSAGDDLDDLVGLMEGL
jgi:hypothetical protein